jgi:MYXO-CTERM domain-containing protein
VEAGFGDTTGGNDAKYGTKKWIAGTIVRASATRSTVDVTVGTQDGEYFGDSGGPLYLHMPDGTWRLIGGDFSSPDWNNSGKPRVSTYTSTPFHVAWAEMQSGIDITPCHDAKGWNPTAACVGSPVNPEEGVGTWARSCAGQTMLVQPTCNGPDGGTIPSVDAGRPTIDAAADAARDANAGRPDATSVDARADEGARPPNPDATGGSNVSDAADQVDTAPPGMGGGAGTTGAGGSGSTGASGGNAGISSGGTAGSAVVPPASNHESASSEGGCSCEIVSPRHTTPTSLFVVLAFAGLARLRRRPWRVDRSLTDGPGTGGTGAGEVKRDGVSLAALGANAAIGLEWPRDAGATGRVRSVRPVS